MKTRLPISLPLSVCLRFKISCSSLLCQTEICGELWKRRNKSSWSTPRELSSYSHWLGRNFNWTLEFRGSRTSVNSWAEDSAPAVFSSPQLMVQPMLNIWRKGWWPEPTFSVFILSFKMCAFSYFYSYSIYKGLCKLSTDRIVCCKLVWGHNLCRKAKLIYTHLLPRIMREDRMLWIFKSWYLLWLEHFPPSFVNQKKGELWNYSTVPLEQTFLNKVFNSWHLC